MILRYTIHDLLGNHASTIVQAPTRGECDSLARAAFEKFMPGNAVHAVGEAEVKDLTKEPVLQTYSFEHELGEYNIEGP